MDYKEHICKDGVRWDEVAFIEYGDVTKMLDIRNANPDIPSYDKIPGGTILQIPILEESITTITIKKPWD